MGDKLRARRIAEALGVPTVPGTDRVATADDLIAFGCRAGYPFLVKASAGGGGRGMRIVRTAEEAPAAFQSAAAEAHAAFGDRTLYIERYIERARHIEIQVIADVHGNGVHLGERDCSTQRRHQKLIEEAPSPVIDAAMRERMAQAAIRLARHVGYTNAGTVEFILDLATRDFYFLEMNTRIQVEHPVTELITGVDIVAEQLAIAGGEPLSITQGRREARRPRDRVPRQRRACRAQFHAVAGSHRHVAAAGGRRHPRGYSLLPGIFRAAIYDSMLAKLIVHGRDRAHALARMRNALAAFAVGGIPTTIPFHQAVLAHPDFIESRVTTQWVESTLLGELYATERIV